MNKDLQIKVFGASWCLCCFHIWVRDIICWLPHLWVLVNKSILLFGTKKHGWGKEGTKAPLSQMSRAWQHNITSEYYAKKGLPISQILLHNSIISHKVQIGSILEPLFHIITHHWMTNLGKIWSGHGLPRPLKKAGCSQGRASVRSTFSRACRGVITNTRPIITTVANNRSWNGVCNIATQTLFEALAFPSMA